MTISTRAALAAAAFALLTIPGGAQADTIRKACLKSPNGAASYQLCGCIQGVADLVLSSRDQRTAAKLFRSPDKAQDMKMSASRSDERFWEKYSYFGSIAQEQCAS
ncbi:hypothetical protein SAMN06297129_1221 [Pseudooceanicola antarcticus]|uniref:Uncharacterized protein n=1 Tax=Pseudooceanicola antarcticus TaxID=1247613 RepID=A0A285IID9_9RHOB|nr:hypothetical protein [Pseudooceanicola antarcticus]PJE28922.1 hypothetical protein CVM39_10725 [Pseudooceanicola antarcticus]SNY47683.1 hypothetical protein SAMN06297129_1221 [Pseudooceanicola antarcticus]